ncbi:uncharacterized protein TNCV_3489591 [Trichonephila clavipes]|nr:uncharacterized protein TNCV_3489591 [Trichonephila clavipes]
MMDRISICEALAKRNEIDTFFKRMVTGDEKWVTYDDIMRKRSWSKRGETNQTVAKPEQPGGFYCVFCGIGNTDMHQRNSETWLLNFKSVDLVQWRNGESEGPLLSQVLDPKSKCALDLDAQEKRNEEKVIDDFISIMDSLIKEFLARFSQFKELSETFKFIMYPDVISFDKLNLSQFDWLEIEELEMQLIDFSLVQYGFKSLLKQGKSCKIDKRYK